MASSNSASIFNLNNGAHATSVDYCDYLYYKLIDLGHKLKLDDSVGVNYLLSKKYKKQEEEIKNNLDRFDFYLNSYSTQHEEFYDEKFKENTKRKKGRYSQLKFSEKADKRLNVSWVKQDIGCDLYVSNKTHKNEIMPDYKKGNVKNFRKNSRQQSRLQTSRM